MKNKIVFYILKMIYIWQYVLNFNEFNIFFMPTLCVVTIYDVIIILQCLQTTILHTRD